MSKSAQRQKKREKKTKNGAGKAPQKGQLIALEGTHGRDLDRVSQRLIASYSRDCGASGVSLWDASNTFFDLREGKGKAKNLKPTPRTLVLLYAADLLFRLRWEIRPALKQGYTVLAAPYVESVMAFGAAAGLPKQWLTSLFSFAPAPSACFRTKEKQRPEKASDGFVEFSCLTLATASPYWDAKRIHRDVLKYFEELEAAGRIRTVTKKQLRPG